MSCLRTTQAVYLKRCLSEQAPNEHMTIREGNSDNQKPQFPAITETSHVCLRFEFARSALGICAAPALGEVPERFFVLSCLLSSGPPVRGAVPDEAIVARETGRVESAVFRWLFQGAFCSAFCAVV